MCGEGDTAGYRLLGGHRGKLGAGTALEAREGHWEPQGEPGAGAPAAFGEHWELRRWGHWELGWNWEALGAAGSRGNWGAPGAGGHWGLGDNWELRW